MRPYAVHFAAANIFKIILNMPDRYDKVWYHKTDIL